MKTACCLWTPLLAAILWLASPPAGAQEQGLITIATAERGGVYHPVGNAVCRLVNARRDRHGLRCLAKPSAGSVQNIETLAAGEGYYAIVQSDLEQAAREGTGRFAGAQPFPGLRSVFSLHPEPFTVLARPDAGIRSAADLKGRRLNVGPQGSGMRATALTLLEAFGWSAEDFALLGDLGPDEQLAAFCEGRVDAMILVVGHPSGWVQDATTACKAVLVPIDGPRVDALLKAAPYYAPAVIDGGTYEGQLANVRTFGVRAVLVTVADRPEAEVYELAKAVFENLPVFKQMHPALARLEPDQMVRYGLAAPLHPGAERYFREIGLLR